MKIKVDFDLCESNAICESLAPEVFQIDENDWLVLKSDEVTEQNRAAVERAVASCPRSAISLGLAAR
ncbi:MAG: ferredoxin [Nocardioides sp.]